MAEKVMEIQMDKLVGFRNHPFQVKDDESLKALCESIRDYGVLSPLLARPTVDGNYEIVSGHRRKAAAMKLGMEKLPVLIREMTDDEAVILMVDSNIQRENLLPSEKAYAYKMKLEAMKRKAGRPVKNNSCQVGTDFIGVRSDELLASNTSESARTIQRYIRLTYLQKPILDLVDEERIAFSPAVELSYLTKLEQAELWDIMQSEDCTPSLSQAVRMKKLSMIAQLTPKMIFDIMSEEKANQKERVRIDVSQLRKYFPKSYTTAQMEKSILRMLEEHHKKKQRNKEVR
ncbi:MAG: ParB/RepB/Spo0J family partition protein [Eubacteriales bacterium]|nr:ParB/RepB/Spo0J family partition protein [Eubacteriales bacterium]